MARERGTKDNLSQDIPVARRFRPRRTPNKKEIAISVILIIFFSIFVVINIGLNLFGETSTDISGRLSTEDSRLLGHLPYPEASKSDLVSIYPGLEVHKDTYKALNEMRSAARAEGIDLVVLSGFRSHDLQEEIFFQVKSQRNQTAIQRAKVSAPPGYSEHSTGYAIDLGDYLKRDTDFSVSFEGTNSFKWLKKNAARFHFILSFPRDNSQGVSYEPWHWRFEGTADALRAFEAARRLSE